MEIVYSNNKWVTLYIKTNSVYKLSELCTKYQPSRQNSYVRPFNKINPVSCVCSYLIYSMKLVYLLISGRFSLTLSKCYVNLSGSTIIIVCVWS